jgi:transcriptional regulator with XRE-family HTH domain
MKGMSEEREVILEQKDFYAALYAKFFGDRRAMAAALGVGPKMVDMLLRGKRKPTRDALTAVGLQVAYRTKWGKVIAEHKFADFLEFHFAGKDAEIAKKLGVVPKLIYLLRTGKRTPSAAILKRCGLEVVYRAVPPEKGKK